MSADRELILTRLIDAPREKVYRAWTDPELLKQWFAPLPYTTPVGRDRRAAGRRQPHRHARPRRQGHAQPRRLSRGRARTSGWSSPTPTPKRGSRREKPFMTVILTFEDEGGKTRYTARVRHWTVADREAHEKMGFHQGWGICTDQLAALVARISPSAGKDTRHAALTRTVRLVRTDDHRRQRGGKILQGPSSAGRPRT